MNAQPIIKLGVPKGSLEEATINLFDRAGWKIRKHTRNYFPEINDPEISASLCRVQEIGGYVAAGILDVGIVGLDWLHEVEHDKDVQIISELAYSKTSCRPCRWVLAVAGDSPYQKPQDLAGKRIGRSGRDSGASCRNHDCGGGTSRSESLHGNLQKINAKCREQSTCQAPSSKGFREGERRHAQLLSNSRPPSAWRHFQLKRLKKS